MEIEYGRFHRRLSLPDDVDIDAAVATCSRGLLTIVLPVADRPKEQTGRIAWSPSGSARERRRLRRRRRDSGPESSPVLPLKETVVFPNAGAARDRAGALDRARRRRGRGRPVRGARHGARPGVEQPGFDDLHAMGTAAIVQKMVKVPDGTLRLPRPGARAHPDRRPRPGGALPRRRDPGRGGRRPGVARGRGADAQRPGDVRTDRRPRLLPPGRAPARRRERRRSRRAMRPRRRDPPPQDGGAAGAARARGRRGAPPPHERPLEPRARGAPSSGRRSSRRSSPSSRRGSGSSTSASS